MWRISVAWDPIQLRNGMTWALPMANGVEVHISGDWKRFGDRVVGWLRCATTSRHGGTPERDYLFWTETGAATEGHSPLRRQQALRERGVPNRSWAGYQCGNRMLIEVVCRKCGSKIKSLSVQAWNRLRFSLHALSYLLLAAVTLFPSYSLSLTLHLIFVVHFQALSPKTSKLSPVRPLSFPAFPFFFSSLFMVHYFESQRLYKPVALLDWRRFGSVWIGSHIEGQIRLLTKGEQGNLDGFVQNKMQEVTWLFFLENLWDDWSLRTLCLGC